MNSKIKKQNSGEYSTASNSNFFKKKGENQQEFFNKTPDEPFFDPARQIQPKLSFGQPNDKFEQEADAMADHVINRSKMPGTLPAHPPEIQSKCSACEEEEEAQTKLDIQKHEEEEEKIQMQHEEEEEEIQMKGNTIQKAAAPSNFESKLRSSGAGRAMPENVRQEMETGLGADLSGVRIHNDANAANLSSAINAQAFTHGNDIYFNQGKFDTSSQSGKHLLAHELTHTIQQGKSKQKSQVQKNILSDHNLPVHTPFNQTQTAAFTQLIQDYFDEPSNESGRAAVEAITNALEQAGEVNYHRSEVVEGSPRFNRRPSMAASEFIGSGNTVAGYTFPSNGKIKVEIYPRAFIGSDVNNSLGFLTSVIIHEYIHVMQNIAGPAGSDAQREFQAWLWQAENITELGISTGTEASRQIASKLRDYYGRLTSSERTSAITQRFNNAISALTPPPPQTAPEVSQKSEEEELQMKENDDQISKACATGTDKSWTEKIAEMEKLTGDDKNQCTAKMIKEALGGGTPVHESTNSEDDLAKAIEAGKYTAWGNGNDINFDANFNTKTGNANQFGEARYVTSGSTTTIYIIMGPNAINNFGPAFTQMAVQHEQDHASDYSTQAASGSPHSATEGEELRIYTRGFTGFFLSLFALDTSACTYSFADDFSMMFNTYSGAKKDEKDTAFSNIESFYKNSIKGDTDNEMKFKIWFQSIMNSRDASDALVTKINNLEGLSLKKGDKPEDHLSCSE